MNHTPYVEFEEGAYQGQHVKRVGCMRCNDTIGIKSPVTNEFYFWDHKRDIKLLLNNGSVAFIPVCSSCKTMATSADHALFENSLKYGWLLEETWLLKRFPQHHPREHVVNAGRVAKDITILGSDL